MTVDRDTVSKFIKEDSASSEILKEMAAEAKNEALAVSDTPHSNMKDFSPEHFYMTHTSFFHIA